MPIDESPIQNVIAALKESESRLNAIIETAVDGIISIDKKGRILSINPSALKLFQYSEEDLVGQNVNVLMPEPYHSAHDGYMGNYHRTGEKKIIGIGRQVLGKKKDGSTFPFKLSVSEVPLDSGTIYTGIVHDLTEQAKAEDELKLMNDSLEHLVAERTELMDEALEQLKNTNHSLSEEISKRIRAEEEMKASLEKEIELGALKSRFVSMASHEFRTPLSGILSSASLIGKYTSEEEDEKRQKHVKRIRSSVQNLTNILNDFLSMDRLQSGKVSLHPSEFMIQELVHEIMEDMQSMLENGKSFSYEHQGENIPVIMDRNIMKNIILNLVSNATKYSDPGTVIELRTRLIGDELTLEVEDHGIGIPEGDKKHMFERFFRAQNATNIKGTGLGLNIVKRYLVLLNGTIEFESREGVGTIFTVCIPSTVS